MNRLLFYILLFLAAVTAYSKPGDDPMPVELLYFEGQAQEHKILLLWGTATEINNYGFFVQRTTDFSSWTEVEFVMGHGTSYVVHHYSSVDSPLTISGTYHYRLKQMDTDGAFKYTDTIAINFVSSMFELIYFEGTAQVNSIRLNWATASELNNQGFSVERSEDLLTWTEINFVNGQGTTTSTTHYSQVDSPVTASGTYHYRLKQVTVGGAFKYSYTVSVDFIATIFQFVYFEGTAHEKSIHLKWAATNEINNYGFSVQKSVDLNEWTEINFINSQGTIADTNYYALIDSPITVSGTYHYRLKQIDFDGSYRFSNVVPVDIIVVSINDFHSTDKGFLLYQNYPNPFNPATKIKYSIPSNLSSLASRPVSLKVYDMLGNEVATLVNDEKAPGQYEIEWNAVGLASGIYIYQLQIGSFINSRKMLLLK